MGVRDLLAVVRASRWWAPKLLPLLAAAELAALAAGADAGPGLAAIGATMASAIAVAALAHLVNDLADVASDRAAGTPNRLEAVGRPAAAALLAVAAVAATAPWWFVPLDPVAGGILAGIVALSVAYSAPPLRLKGRGVAGVVADALVAHALPTAFAFAQLGGVGTRTAEWWAAGATAVLWALAFGTRSIVVHELGDAPGDRRAGVTTYVVLRGPAVAARLGRDAFGVEVLCLVALLAVTLVLSPWAGAFFIAHHLLWLHHRRFEHPTIDSVPAEPGAWLPVSEFYVLWPAVAFGVSLAAVDPSWWWLPGLIAVLFWPTFSKQVADQLAQIVELLGEIARHGGVAGRRFVVSPLRDRAWPAMRGASIDTWWVLYRAHWRFRHAVVDRIVAFWRRQGRRARRRLRGPTPPH